MKARPERNIEIFSLSAIDLFAAAMGAFALLAIILLPYYQNEIREDTPENAISDLLRAAETSTVEAIEQKKALEVVRSAKRSRVSDVKTEEEKLLAELRAAQDALKTKQAASQVAIVVPEPQPEKKPAPPAPRPEAKITFRFLGMKTKKDDIVVALDMNRCMAGHEQSVQKAMERIISSLQPNHKLRVVGFQQTDAGPRTRIWPTTGSMTAMTGGNQSDALRFSDGLTSEFGGSAAMLDAFGDMLAGPGDAIFLVSDGLPNPRANGGKTPQALAREITRMNGGKKEIHTVVVGNYFDYRGTVEFMEELARRNDGQFMALASTNRGICD